MIEFDTNEDLHTIMKYKQQEARANRIHPMYVRVDIDELANTIEMKCKMIAAIHMESLGIPSLINF